MTKKAKTTKKTLKTAKKLEATKPLARGLAPIDHHLA